MNRVVLKSYKWNYSTLEGQLVKLKAYQERTIFLIYKDPQNPILLDDIIDINARYNKIAKMESFWFSQMAKAF